MIYFVYLSIYLSIYPFIHLVVHVLMNLSNLFLFSHYFGIFHHISSIHLSIYIHLYIIYLTVILRMYQHHLLELTGIEEVGHFLGNIPNTINSNVLFQNIGSINIPEKKFKQFLTYYQKK